jgi:hypothetical protein
MTQGLLTSTSRYPVEADGTTRVAWYDPLALGARHGLTGQDARLSTIGEKLRALAESLV